MERSQLLFLTVLACIVNGIFSPFVPAIFILWPVWYPALLLPISMPLILFLSSIMLATATLLASGVPAAIYERIAGSQDSDRVSVGIWLVGAILLSLPALRRVLDFL